MNFLLIHRKMKTFKIILLSTVIALSCVNCSEDTPIGEPITLTPPYELPEGDSETDQMVREYFYKYGTFLLFDFTDEDFNYGNTTKTPYVATRGDKAYLPEMLELLNDVWLGFYPESFKEKYFPFKIYLVDKVSYTNPYSGSPTYYDYVVRDNDIVIAGMNENLHSVTSKDKQRLKSLLNSAYMSYLLKMKEKDGSPLLKIPGDFYTISDYTSDFIPTNKFKAEENPDKYLEFGYLPNLDYQYSSTMGTPLEDGTKGGQIMEWATSVWNANKENDIKHFLANMLAEGDDFPTYPDYPSSALTTSPFVPYENRYTWNYYLQKNDDGTYKFPRIQKKLEILEGYFKDQLGVDLRAIGNTKFE